MSRSKLLAEMTQSNLDDGMFAIVELNYQGVFTRNPLSYFRGVKSTFNDVNFSTMTYSECVTYLERFMYDEIKTLYYYEPKKSMTNGIRPILNNVDYIDEEQNEDADNDPCADGVENGDNLKDVEVENDEDAIPMNRTYHDPFFSKLCVRGVHDDEIDLLDDNDRMEIQDPI
ncbi:unnamed protein product [Lactuca saligna]|uniref:PB1-like domain-containing protein n=1 Tax=Lactuca saligna TaxID=75948 RepID=A0AA35VCC3_LACSI|nr:unnamed protein product [Lactuca saligna]